MSHEVDLAIITTRKMAIEASKIKKPNSIYSLKNNDNLFLINYEEINTYTVEYSELYNLFNAETEEVFKWSEIGENVDDYVVMDNDDNDIICDFDLLIDRTTPTLDHELNPANFSNIRKIESEHYVKAKDYEKLVRLKNYCNENITVDEYNKMFDIRTWAINESGNEFIGEQQLEEILSGILAKLNNIIKLCAN